MLLAAANVCVCVCVCVRGRGAMLRVMFHFSDLY